MLIVCGRTVLGRLREPDKLLRRKGRSPVRAEEQYAEPCNTTIWVVPKSIIVGTTIMSTIHNAPVVQGRKLEVSSTNNPILFLNLPS
jgi:hypothetical protein